jgi:AcrR family transcriptional regulator
MSNGGMDQPVVRRGQAVRADPRGHQMRSRILDEAERLFADFGFDGVSTRKVAAGAGVNISALYYYFPGKEGLFEAAFVRRIEPINRERLAELERLLAADGPTLEQVIAAWIRPLLGDDDDPKAALVMRFIAKVVSSDFGGPASWAGTYDEVGRRFVAALQRCLPDDDITDLVWKYNFMIGVLVYTLGGRSLPARVPQDLAHVATELADNPPANNLTLDRLVSFVAAGMGVPLPTLGGAGDGRHGER